jgi:glycosyltransferase involved in cell wall biosynthesis
MTVSIVVITRNRSNILSKCIHHLINQSVKADRILIIDSSDDQNSKNVCSRFNTVEYYYLKSELGDQPKIRNYALKMIQTDIIAFIDDDGFAHEDWVKEILNTYTTDLDIGGVGGRIIQGDEIILRNKLNNICGLYNYFKWSFGSFNVVSDTNLEVKHFQGTNMTFKTHLLKTINGFDENLCHGYASFEDTDICLSILHTNHKLVYNPNVIVTHGLYPRENGLPRDLSLNLFFTFSYARNGVYVLLKHNGINLKTVFSLFILVPLLNLKRILIRNTTNFHSIRVYFAFLFGMVSGYKIFKKNK